MARADVDSITMYILAGLLAVGALCNWLVTPVAAKHHMSEGEAATEKKAADDTHQHFVSDVAALGGEVAHSWKVFAAWAVVWVPLAWGIWITLTKALVLFR